VTSRPRARHLAEYLIRRALRHPVAGSPLTALALHGIP